MRSTTVISALAGAALASGHRTLIARDGNCAKQPAGSGPVASNDTIEGFFGITQLQTLSSSAPTPDGYTSEFVGLNASLNADKYMGLWTLKSYDTLECASLCDRAIGCQAFNMYSERDPTVDPSYTNNCANPPSLTNYKCTLFGASVSQSQAVNFGQWRDDFHVVITGSNAYNKVPAPANIPGYESPLQLGGVINAPLLDSKDTYMGLKYYSFSEDQTYDPSVCAKACDSQTAYNKAHPAADGSFMTCRFFNSYIQSTNGVADQIHCSLYSAPWSQKYATNYGQYRGSDRITVSRSYSYTLSEASA